MTAGSWPRRAARRLLGAVLWFPRRIWVGLVTFGGGMVGVHTPLADPPPGHPERCRPDQPLTEAERVLARQLPGGRRRTRSSR